MYIYRLETAEGNGPFFKDQEIVSYLIQHNDPTEQHMLDSIKHTRKQFDQLTDYVYAWKSKKLANAFVKAKYRNVISLLGWRVNRYKVSKHSVIRFHDGQVLFRKEHAELLGAVLWENKLSYWH